MSRPTLSSVPDVPPLDLSGGHQARLRVTSRVVLLAMAASTLIGLPIASAEASPITSLLSIVAGTGASGTPVVGQAVASPLGAYSEGIAADPNGGYYVTDGGQSRVDRVDASGHLTVFAGSGVTGQVAPGAAVDSPMKYPHALAVDLQGNVYIGDADAHQVYKVDLNGDLSVVAGDGSAGTPTSGQATSVSMGSINGLAVDASHNIYVADTSNNVIERIDPAGALSIFAGDGNPGVPSPGDPALSHLTDPSAVAVDSAGAVYIADSTNHVVEKVENGVLSIVVGSGMPGSVTPGAATASDLGAPDGLAVGSDGALYVTVSSDYQVYRVASGQLSVLAGSGNPGAPQAGVPTDSTLLRPIGVAVDSDGNVLVSDVDAHQVLQISPAAAPSFTGQGAPTTATVGTPYAGYTFTATGTPAPTFSVVSGSLPTGLSLATTGALSGTPTTAGSSTFTVRATNGAGTDDTSSITLTVAPTPVAPSFTAQTPPGTGTVGTPYAGYTFTATGTPTPTYGVVGGSLPTGLSLNTTTGALSGTPTAAGTSTFRVAATNSVTTVNSSLVTVTVTPAPAAPSFTAKTPPTTATVGTTYPSYSFAASGYPVPTFTVVSGALPDGMTLSTAGLLAGSPTASGSFPFAVRASNTRGSATTSTITLVVAAAPVATAPVFTAQTPPTTAKVGAPYSYTFAASGYPAPDFTVVPGTLPGGLTLSTAGVLTGSPTTAGSFTFAVTAANTSGPVTTSDITVNVEAADSAPILTAQTPTTTATVGSTYPGYTFTATGYPAPTFSVSSGSLPAGLSISPSGVLAGTPTASGSFTFKVTATNASGSATTTAITLAVAKAPSFTASTPPTSGTVGTAYAGYTFAATGYPAPEFTVGTGTLPAGLSLGSTTGVLSGTPTVAGSSTFTVYATNATGSDTTAEITVTVVPAALAPTFVAQTPATTATVGTDYPGYTFTATGYPAPTFSVAPGTLPTGLTLSSSGVLSGRPTASGSFPFTVIATNATATDTTSVTVAVAPANAFPVLVNKTPPVATTVGKPYSYAFSATGYPTPTFAVGTGSLPAGLGLDGTTGVLSGTPTTDGPYTFTVRAINSSGWATTAPITVAVDAAAASFTAQTPPATAKVGTPYSYTFAASGYPDPTFGLASGTLPPGLSLVAGVLSGTPTTAGPFSFTVSAINATATDTTSTLTVTVDPADNDPAFIHETPPTTATTGTAYSYTFTASGYPTPEFSTTDTLPAGLTLSSSGVLSGVPTQSGPSAPFTVTATNDGGSATTADFVVVVNDAPAFTDSTPTDAKLGTPYTYQFTASGYPAPAFTLGSGTVPAGLTLETSGLLHGTPLADGISSMFTVTATNGSGTVNTAATTLTTNSDPAFTASTPTTAHAGVPYSYTFTATGFPAPAFAVASGTLPAGLTLHASGVLDGTPTADGVSTPFTVTATNSSDTATTSAITMTTNSDPAFTADAPTTAKVGTPYSYTFEASGYPAPTFTLGSGTPPAGLTLHASGVLDGTPTADGVSAPFTVTATNSSSAVTTSAVTMTTNSDPAFTAATPTTAQTGVSYSYTFTASGYPAPAFGLGSGTLPDGLTLHASGVLDGIPTADGVSTPFTVTATNTSDTATTSPVTLTTNSTPVFTATAAPTTAKVGVHYRYTFRASGYPTPTYTVGTGALPAGLTLDATTGVLDGTPTTDGPFTFAVWAVNTAGNDTAARTVTVDPVDSFPAFGAKTPPTTAKVGAAYSYTFTASGFPAPTFTATDAPAWLHLATDGVVSGSPTTAGTTAPFTVTATNSTGSVTTSDITVAVDPADSAPALIASTPPTTATVGTAYSYTFTASGFPAPSFTAVGALPDGLTLNSSGVLSGNPTTAGSSAPFTVTATNTSGTDTTSSITVVVAPAPTNTFPVFANRTPPSTATVGDPYSYTFTASGYPAPTFTVGSGALPAGITLDATTGVVSGRPSTAGTATFAIRAANSSGSATTTTITVTVSPADSIPVFTAQTPSTTATVGSTYPSYTFLTANGYPAATTFSVSSGFLPSGLTLDPTSGVLSGSPIAAGASAFQVSATNRAGTRTTSSITITVVPADSSPAFTAETPSTTATVGTTYPSYTFASTGYPAPTYTVGSGSLPAGLTLDPTSGALSGSPTAAGTSTFQVLATNRAGTRLTDAVTVTVTPAAVAPAWTAETPPTTAVVGSSYTYTFAATGYPAPGFTVTGTLPDGLSFNRSTGVLSGIPTTPGSSGFTVTAASTSGSATTSTITVAVAPADSLPVFTAETPSTTATVGTPYHYTFAATGYPTPTFHVGTGSLPAGLSLDQETGVLSGSPTADGPATFTVNAVNRAGTQPTAGITVTVSPADSAPAFTDSTPPATATVGTSYRYTFTATGYPAPEFTVNGTLPDGLTLNTTTGVLSGVPTTAGTSDPFTVTAHNRASASTTEEITVTVSQAPTLVAKTPPATATVGTAYLGYTFTATGYPAPEFTVGTGALPAGLTLNPTTGVLSGQPTTAGPATFTVRATNATSSDTTTSITVTVAQAPAFIAQTPPLSALVGTAYPSYTFTASGYPTPTFTVGTGALPAGLALNATTGVLSGTPTSGGTSSFTVRATNATSTVSTDPIQLTVVVPGNTYVAMTPCRLFDTRTGQGTCSTVGSPGAGSTPVTAGRPRAVSIGGVAIDRRATAVVLNLTATGATASTFVTAYTGGSVQPVTSSINLRPGQVVPNLVTVPLSTDGKILLAVGAGNVSLIGDLVGYYVPSNAGIVASQRYSSVTPCRLFDTRTPAGGCPSSATIIQAPVRGGSALTVKVTGKGGLPTTGVTAVALNLTAMNATLPTAITAYAGGATRPSTSVLNPSGPGAVANSVIVPVALDGTISLYNAAGSVNLIADVAGYYGTSASDEFHPVTPCRVYDTRSSRSTCSGDVIQSGGLRTGSSFGLHITGVGGVPVGASAAVLNVVALGATAPTYLSVYPASTLTVPNLSTVNVSDANPRANQVAVKLAAGVGPTAGMVTVHNNAGAVDAIVDLAGYFTPAVG